MTRIIDSRLFKSLKDGQTYLTTKSTWKKGDNPSDYKLKLQRVNSDGTLSEPLITKTVTNKITKNNKVLLKKIVRETKNDYFEIAKKNPSITQGIMNFTLRSKKGYEGKPYALKGELLSSTLGELTRFKVPDISHKNPDEYPLYLRIMLKKIHKAVFGKKL
jgi:hypothetical protein